MLFEAGSQGLKDDGASIAVEHSREVRFHSGASSLEHGVSEGLQGSLPFQAWDPSVPLCFVPGTGLFCKGNRGRLINCNEHRNHLESC